MISLRHPQRSPLVRHLARGLIGLLALAGTPLEVWAARFDPPLSSTKTPMGNRETATDSRGTTNYTYDNRNRLETLTYPDGRKLTYGYDANGNRTSLTAEVGGQTLTTTYSYDELNRLQTVTDSEGRDYLHEYDPNGNRQKLTYPNNTETSYVYDDLNRLTNLTTINTATLGMIQSYQFTLGAAGNRERIDEHDGTSRAYAYDDLYRLEKETVSGSVGLVYEKSFVYDPVGNRETQVTIGAGAPGTPTAPGTIDYTYDDRDRILTEGTQPYSWDANGNLVTKDAEASYFWDFESRLTRVEKTDGTVVAHAYDADGNRVRTTTAPAVGSPEVIDFLIDTAGSLSQSVAESSGFTLLAHYVRGVEVLAAIRTGASKFFHHDGLGSVRRLTSESGTILDGYTYSAFGEPLAHTGTDSQPYSFAGEPLDQETRLQYHRARWLDPSTGTFLSIDPFRGVTQRPLTLHRYSYALVSPQDNIDPSGEITLSTQLTISAAVTTLAVGTLAAANLIGVSNSFFRALGGGSLPPIRLTTQPIVAEGSGWSDSDVAAMLLEASRVWAIQANIHVSWKPIIRTKEFISNRDPIKVLEWYHNGPTKNFDLVMDKLGGDAKHISVFVGYASGVLGFGSINTNTESRHFGRGFAFVASGGSWWTLAHEWGHTFGLAHLHTLLRFVPFSPNLMSYMGGSGLSPIQVEAARAVAESYE